MSLDEIKIGGLGASRPRVEDNRFVRGKGNYIDDITLPAMLHMEILRSPLAHARIKSVDVSAAWAIPGVRLVLTGEFDGGCNPRLNRLIAEELPHAELVVLPAYKHAILFEAGEAVARHLIRFMSDK